MRSVESFEDPEVDMRELAEIAASSVNAGMDTYSDYSVGAAVAVSFHTKLVGYEDNIDAGNDETHVETRVYAGSNINLSGMEVKIHAEQLALFQAMLDIEEKGLEPYSILQDVMVVTSEDDMALRCGHCLQTFAGVCDHYDWDETNVGYHAAAGQSTYDDRGNPDGVHFDYDENSLADLLPESYVEKN